MIGIFSRRMYRIPHLAAFLGDTICFRPSAKTRVDAVAGWGRKPTARRAMREAAGRDVPYLAVEDGFYRSLGLGVAGHPPLSLVVDPRGVHYDSGSPSLLEKTLEKGSIRPEHLALAPVLMQRIASMGLSKYNHAPTPDGPLLPRDGRERLLLVDQTRGDLSVSLGQGGEHVFAAMLDHARQRFPDALPVVKLHPDVICGKKRGYLSEMDLSGCMLLGRDVNPVSLLREVDQVFTVSSQLGFEGLLLGRTVHCFGMPFYAGWGATCDHATCARRTVRRTAEEIFAAACLEYSRYVNPFSGRACSMEEALDILWDQKRANDRVRGTIVCAGFSLWRKTFAKRFLGSTQGKVLHRRTARGAVRAALRHGGRVAVWAPKAPPRTGELCARHGVELLRMEDGFIRSIGLGAHFHQPHSLCIDPVGIHYDPNRESALERILNRGDFDPHLLDRARRLRLALCEHAITKYNLDERKAGADLRREGAANLLVLGQVEGDASVRAGGLGIYTNLDFLGQVRRHNPQAHIIYKPHPDVTAGKRPGSIPEHAGRAAYDVCAPGISAATLFEVADEIHVLTSLAGFEALVRGKKVTTYGGPFYAGWGLTTDMRPLAARTARLTLDQLVAGALVLYATNAHGPPPSFCRPEDLVELLASRKGRGPDLARYGFLLLSQVFRLLGGGRP